MWKRSSRRARRSTSPPRTPASDPFTGQPGRYSRAPTGTGIWGGRTHERSYYADAHAGIMRAALGNTELELHGLYYRHAAPTGRRRLR